jgi:acyl-CoA synthetase (AMP-forming)/AMP-acid ligase II
MLRSRLAADPQGRFLHDVILESCCCHAEKIAIVDSSCGRQISYSEYADIVEALARGFVAAGLKPDEVIAIYLPNSWEFCVTYHAITLAGGIPTLLNPSYREREVRYQLENSGAAFLMSDGANLDGINLAGLPNLRRVYTTRQPTNGSEMLASFLKSTTSVLPKPVRSSAQTLAALPYSSGTTGLPKGVMLSHYNLVANVFQLLGPHGADLRPSDIVLCFLPLYHIYGLNVLLNPVLALGATVVLMSRFQPTDLFQLLAKENITMMPTVPPALNVMCQAAEQGQFPKNHRVRWVKSGAAPLAPELARRFTSLTGIPICQGYGMTEASPVTHLGYLDHRQYCPESIGQPMAKTECRLLGDNGEEMPQNQPGELVMRGPQFMLGYWKEPQATSAVLRDGWYWSGDIVCHDENNFFYVLDRRKEMIKYKGFSVAPAEIEAVLLEHPAVRECGVIGRPDNAAGETPMAFVALRDGTNQSAKLKEELCAFVAERLTSYKQPREVRFVDSIPKTASGKILRRELRAKFTS